MIIKQTSLLKSDYGGVQVNRVVRKSHPQEMAFKMGSESSGGKKKSHGKKPDIYLHGILNCHLMIYHASNQLSKTGNYIFSIASKTLSFSPSPLLL